MSNKFIYTLFILINAIYAQAQQRDTTARDVETLLKSNVTMLDHKEKFGRIYFDASAGINLLNLHYLGDASMGLRFNEASALGFTYIAGSDYGATMQGLGLQFRWTPQRNSLFKIDIGKVTKAGTIDRSGSDVYEYLRGNGADLYLRLGAYLRFSEILTIGISYLPTTALNFSVSKLVNGQLIPTNQTFGYGMAAFCPQLGITIPSMPKKRINK
jgi:hypothetical protein